MEEENHGLTMSLFLTHQQVRQLEEEKTHLQQMINEMKEENHALQQQVSLHYHCYVDSSIN